MAARLLVAAYTQTDTKAKLLQKSDLIPRCLLSCARANSFRLGTLRLDYLRYLPDKN
jgi:hypothetical protein